MRLQVPKSRINSGFTLVELLIVVIILAILAAIVIPQFTSATTDAQEAALDADLAALRNAIALYQVQHGGSIYPGAATSGAGGACNTTGTAGNAAAGSAQAFMDSLLMPSDVTGKTCGVADATTYKFGPYLRKGIPPDPITQKGSVAGDITVTTTGVPIVPTVTTGGWAYDTKSGQIVMNSTTNDSKSKAYYTH